MLLLPLLVFARGTCIAFARAQRHYSAALCFLKLSFLLSLRGVPAISQQFSWIKEQQSPSPPPHRLIVSAIPLPESQTSLSFRLCAKPSLLHVRLMQSFSYWLFLFPCLQKPRSWQQTSSSSSFVFILLLSLSDFYPGFQVASTHNAPFPMSVV